MVGIGGCVTARLVASLVLASLWACQCPDPNLNSDAGPDASVCIPAIAVDGGASMGGDGGADTYCTAYAGALCNWYQRCQNVATEQLPDCLALHAWLCGQGQVTAAVGRE